MVAAKIANLEPGGQKNPPICGFFLPQTRKPGAGEWITEAPGRGGVYWGNGKPNEHQRATRSIVPSAAIKRS